MVMDRQTPMKLGLVMLMRLILGELGRRPVTVLVTVWGVTRVVPVSCRVMASA